MRALLALLTLLVAAAAWLGHENRQLARSLDAAHRAAETQQQTIGSLHARLAAERTQSRNNERAQLALRQRLDAAGTLATRREQTLTRLLHENAALRRWYDAELPDAVRELHQRPGYASAGDYLHRLSAGDALPDAGQRSTH